MLEENNNEGDGINTEENKLNTMGATRNMTASRITVLQERKKEIEETLTKKNHELRQLCIQEAELTGITPPEMPLEPGETLPLIRRRVGTSYQLPENLIQNASNKDEMIADLELQIQLHVNMAEAALGLASEHNMSKTIKRQHRSEYQKHKQQCLALQDKLAGLKEKAAADQQKQKKKPRAPDCNDDTISVSTNGKSDIRHSMSTLKKTVLRESGVEIRYHQDTSRPYRMSEVPYLTHQTNKSDDILISGFYRLSLNGYNKYMERHENINPSNYILQQTHHQYSSSQMPLLNQNLQHSLPYQQNSSISQHHLHVSQNGPHYIHMPQQKTRHSPQQRLSHYTYYSPDHTEISYRQSSPTASVSPKSHYYPSHPTLSKHRFESEVIHKNPHQIQPHQQYEQINVVTSGLGGYWKKTPNGELVWYSSNVMDATWQRDKRFGSLDRRKSKRLTSKISPSMDKSATLSSVPNYQGQVRSVSVKSSQILNRQSQDNVHLVRTQSLGSVGAITVDNVYPTDDSDSRNLECNQILKKQKEKEWLETSLDGPVAPVSPLSLHGTSLHGSGSIPTCETPLTFSEPTAATFSTEEKVSKEIPAESNPSLKVREPNIELFNNIPKNCTLVQAGHCKPYHEETKPFEMSDFYKYSTKFNKSPTKNDNESKQQQHFAARVSKSFNKFDEDSSASYSPSFQPISTSSVSLDNSINSNTSLNLDQFAVSEHFSDEMNAWYKKKRQDNNNPNTNPKNRSAATLV